jgi:hypothetical protein
VSYTPSVDDLGDEPMSDEVKRVADGVLPWNRERMAELNTEFAAQMAEFNAALQRIAAAMSEAMRPLLASLGRFGETMRTLARLAVLRRRRYRTRPLVGGQTVRYFDRRGRAHWRPMRA